MSSSRKWKFRLRHRVDMSIVWKALHRYLPPLVPLLEGVLASEPDD